MRAMPIMSHQRAFVALGMVVLGARKSVVDDERCARREPASDIFNQRLGVRIDLAQVIAVGRESSRGERYEPFIEKWPLRPGESIGLERHAALQPCAAATRDQMHGNRVEQFVHDDRAVDLRRQLGQPFDV